MISLCYHVSETWYTRNISEKTDISQHWKYSKLYLELENMSKSTKTVLIIVFLGSRALKAHKAIPKKKISCPTECKSTKNRTTGS